MAEPAPFFADIADGPDTVQTHWVTAKDGVRLRVAIWPEGSKGTVLLFPGRSEYIEKYSLAAEDLRLRGYATVSIDWRGQGLADRLVADPMAGFVQKYPDYQMDVAAMLGCIAGMDLPMPLFLLAHSMSGAIGLRALMEELPVAAAAFTAPMFGVSLSPTMRPVAWGLSWASRQVGKGTAYVPGSSSATYVLDAPFEENSLTSDRDMYEHMQRQLREHPELAIGGATYHWLNEALKECRRLAKRPSPDYPTLTFMGSEEKIIDPEAVHDRMSRWENGRLEILPGAEHEVMMEKPETRKRVFDLAAVHFDAHSHNS